MKVINLGSINIDHVYCVEHFVKPGETLRSKRYQVFAGGKGANQSIALARAGTEVFHAGKIGKDGLWLKDKLQNSKVDTTLIKTSHEPTGHAVIQVNDEGENAIVIYGGANDSFLDEEIEDVLRHTEKGDFLVLQNEINSLEKILQLSKKRGVRVIFNPAPMNEKVKSYPLECVNTFIINALEGEMLTGEDDPEKIVSSMQDRYPQSTTVLTLGKKGLIYRDENTKIKMDALEVKSIDTTGAGDTFIGYFVAGLAQEESIEKCLQMGVKASALCVGCQGAADSIPTREEVENFNAAARRTLYSE